MNKTAGISAIGLSIPPTAIKLDDFAQLHNVDPAKYLHGLGCQEMAICPKNFGTVDLAAIAAERALAAWGGKLSDIGMVAVGTESGLDMSRPLSSWIMERLKLKGAIRSYEVKHACFGGTLALRQAVEWKLANNDKGRVALVIAADQGLYSFAHPGEPTQGSAAIAFIIDNNPTIAAIHPISYAWSSPEYDFWRPIGELYPNVNGRLSMECYKLAVIECFRQLMQDKSDLTTVLEEFAYCCFHVPFPKMVQKAFTHLCTTNGIDQLASDQLYAKKIAPTMAWNTKIGNCYTASLWFSVANALANIKQDQQLLSFSYGSGFGAELLTMTTTNSMQNAIWQQQLQADFDNRQLITPAQYLELRGVKLPSKVASLVPKIKEQVY